MYAIRSYYEMQNEISLEDQETVCRQLIAEKGGVVVGVYKDGAKNGWSLDRDGFQDMRSAAERGKFDGIASNRGSACRGEYVPGSCTHRPSHHGSGFCQK